MSINNPLNPLNLSNGTYFIRTSDTQNPYLGIRGLDDIVSKGVFSFLINGSSYLQQGTDIQFEAIDSGGNQISINGVRNLLKGTSRVISFEIDDRISNGEGTLYISANLDSYLENDVETDIPTTFQNTSNFLFEYKFQIDKTRVNTDEIIFRKPPILTITPSLKTVRDITKTSTTTSTLSGDVKQYYYDESTSSYTILIESASGTYSFDMNGGIATITNSLGLTIQGIVNVVDSSTIFTTIQNPDIEVYSKEEFKGILSSPLSFTISYITIPDISEVRLQETAVATIDIKDMGVVSGDVAKIKVFGKSDSLNSNYVLLSELDVENKNLLELEGTGSVGIFDTSKKVGAWSVSKEQVSATNPTIVSNDDIFLSGLVINGDYDSPTTVEINGRTLQTPRYVLESDIDLDVKKNIDYNLRLNAAVSDVSASDTRLDVYFKSTSIKSDNKFGKLIHSFRADSDKIWRDQFSIVFSVDSDVTDGELVFTTTSGRWYVQDIRLTADVQDGFSPQEFRTEIPLNISKPNQDIDFKVEFFDANNNKADKVLTKDNIIFERPNIVVEGGKNVTVGEMYLGEDSSSGVVTGGSGNGGIVKSFGYQGFAEATGVGGTAGFLMYSGSVLTGSATTYQGVGLELVASSESFFRYRTNPSELDIRTNKFFIGQEATQFISGAESNIEISSSLFHLDPKNNLLVIGTDAIINADLTVNEIRTPALIGGSPSTTANASSSINSDGFAKFVSASIGGFDVLETQINSTNDNLVLKSNGQITGSTVLFDGGTIGGFSLSGDGISGDGYLISGSATGDDFFISASNFNVKANGNITGSQVLFTGGKITGSNIMFDVTQFVAKGDTVEISGSNFHLLEGNITASNVDLTGNISANTGNIGNFEIIDGKISGSNITLDANNSTIFKTDQGPGSDPQSSGFEYLADEYYIDFTPTEENPDNFFVKFGPNFMVDRDGILIASGAEFQGTITASAGTLGGFTIASSSIFSAGNSIFISGSPLVGGVDSTPYMFISTSNFNVKQNGDITGSNVLFTGGKITGSNITFDVTEFIAKGDTVEISGSNFHLLEGNITASNVDLSGTITANAGEIGGFTISQDALSSGNNFFLSGSAIGNDFFISSSKFNVKANGDVTGSNVLFTGGKISGSDITFDVTEFVAKGDTVEISGSNFHLLEGNITASNVDLSGTITATAGEIGGFVIESDEIRDTGNNLRLKSSGQITGSQVLFTGGNIGGFVLESDEIRDSGNNLRLKSSGEITGSQVLFTGGTVGGFTITDNLITASNLEINSDGTIQTPNFADGVRGFQITAAGNGSAQFENVKIRGTLRTTVFEKETVNAVGGQLWVANSTALSQSVTSGETTMSVENVTGFEVGEILLIKKVDGTGFNSEYVLIESSSRTDGASDTNLTGRINVIRGYSSGLPTGSDVTWVSELASSAEDYSDGQVLVSTGKQDTGWILLNASPNNTYTPYIDIVERTGSGVYDYELKARLGDLSGLSSTQLLGNSPTTAGFGLFSENVFLQGGITATYGSIGGFGITDTAISSSNDNLILRSNGQITGSTVLFDGGRITGSNIVFDVENFIAKGDTVEISGSNFHLLNGNITASNVDLSGTITATAGEIGGFIIETDEIRDNSNNLRLKSNGQITGSNVLFDGGKITGSNIEFDVQNFTAKGDSVEISGSNFHLLNGNITASNVDLSGTITATAGEIGGFTISQDSLSSGNNFFLSGSATGNDFFISSSKFNVKANGDVTGSQVLFTGGNITGSNITFDVTNFIAKGDTVEISGSNFHLLEGNITASNVDLSGTITATAGEIGGFSISQDALSSGTNFFLSGSATGDDFFISSSNFNVKANGNLTASNAEITGEINAETGTIGGFTIADNLTNSGGSTLILKGSTGEITASAAQITGNITAEEGNIGGFTIDADEIKSTNLLLNSSLEKITVGSGGEVTLGKIATNQYGLSLDSNNFWIYNTGDYFFSVGDGADNEITFDTNAGVLVLKSNDSVTLTGDSIEISGSNFHLLEGNITASNVDLSGNINAETGTIGGFTISQDALSSGDNFFISGSATGTDYFISSSKFHVTAVGNVTAEDLTLNDRTLADAFVFNLLKITSTNENTYLKPHSSAAGYVLDLSGVTVDTAQFVRFESSITFTPNITHIVPPQNASANFGFRVVLEHGGGDFVLEDAGGSETLDSPFVLNYDGSTTSISSLQAINADSQDSFMTQGGTYTPIAGERLDLIKSANDYKIQGSSAPRQFRALKLAAGGENPPINVFDVRHSGTAGDNGILIIREDTTVSTNDLLGAIGFGSEDVGEGSIENSAVESSAFIAAYASEAHGLTDRGGYLELGVLPTTSTTPLTVVEITENGMDVTGDFTATGEVTAYASDERLKIIHGNIENPLDKIDELNGFYYNWNDTAKKLGIKHTERKVGVSAQQVQKVLPEITPPAPVDENYLTVQYDKLVPLLIEGIKELRQDNKKLKDELNNIKKQLK